MSGAVCGTTWPFLCLCTVGLTKHSISSCWNWGGTKSSTSPVTCSDGSFSCNVVKKVHFDYFWLEKIYFDYFWIFIYFGSSVSIVTWKEMSMQFLKREISKEKVEHFFVMISCEVWWPQSLISRTYCYYTYHENHSLKPKRKSNLGFFLLNYYTYLPPFFCFLQSSFRKVWLFL